MNIQARKLNLIEEFLRINDEHTIEELESFFRIEKNRQNEREMKPMSLEQFREMIEQAKQDKANGRVISHEEVKMIAKSWK